MSVQKEMQKRLKEVIAEELTPAKLELDMLAGNVGNLRTLSRVLRAYRSKLTGEIAEEEAKRRASEKTKPCKKTRARVRGRNIPNDVKEKVFEWLELEYNGGVKGEGWQEAFDSFTLSKYYTPLLQQHIGSAASLKRIVEAARKDAKRTKRKTRGQKK